MVDVAPINLKRAAADDVRPIQERVESAEVDGLVCIDGEGLSGEDVRNTGNLPAARDLLDESIRIAQHSFAMSERQLVHEKSDESVPLIAAAVASFQVRLEAVVRLRSVSGCAGKG